MSCIECIRLADVCDDCKRKCRIVYRPAHPIADEDEDEEDYELDIAEEDEGLFDEDIDISFSDGEEEEEGEEVDDDEDAVHADVLGPGGVCWAKLRSWFPVQICRENEIPPAMRRFLPMNSTTDFVVKKFAPFDGQQYRVVKFKNLDFLAENEIDKWRASRNDLIAQAYNRALATHKGQI